MSNLQLVSQDGNIMIPYEGLTIIEIEREWKGIPLRECEKEKSVYQIADIRNKLTLAKYNSLEFCEKVMEEIKLQIWYNFVVENKIENLNISLNKVKDLYRVVFQFPKDKEEEVKVYAK